MAEPGESLSDRELAVLEGLIAGSTNRQIAHELDISPNTVKVHVRNIFTKLGVSSRTEAATLAIQRGVVKVPALDPDPEPVQQPTSDPADELDATLETSPGRKSYLRWIIFVMILLAGLIIGALAGEWLGAGDPTPDAPASVPDAQTTPLQTVAEPFENTRWFAGESLPRARANMAMASVGLNLYLIGGEVEAGVVNLVNILETDSGEWQSASAKPTAVSETTAAVLFGEIYVPGGRLSDGRPTAVVESFSPANNAWRPVSPLPRPISGGLILSDGNTLYFMGGWDGERFLADGYVYDPVEDNWASLPPMKHARANAAGGLVTDRLYVIGGQDGEQDLALCEYYDPGENAWFDCPAMETARSFAGAAPLANRYLYLIGGASDGQVSFGEVLDIQTNQWERVEMPMLDGVTTWPGLGVTSVESRLFVLGGLMDGQITTKSYVYAPLLNRTYLPSIGSE